MNFPAKTSELVGTGVTEFGRRGDQLATETLRRLADEGVDTLQVVAQSCREAGMRCYASMRMNGDYAMQTGGPGDLLNSNFYRAHPEFRVRGPKGEQRIVMSYGFAEVREFKLAILRAAAERDIDGVQLDFLRHPPFFGYEEPLVQAFTKKDGEDPRTLAADDARWLQFRADVMTGFLRDIRKMLDEAGAKKGRRIGLAARVDWREYTERGCDIATWLREGLLDYLALAQHSLGGYEFDLAPFVKMARGSGCAVLFGEEGITSGHDTTAAEDKLIAAGKMEAPKRGGLTLEQHQARAARWYAAGADGVHLFNVGNRAVMKTLGSVKAGADFFRATISPVSDTQHGQWNVALTGLAPGRVLAIWEAGHTEVKTPNVIMSAQSEDDGATWLGGGVISTELPGGAMEPALVETAGGEWLCVIRTRGTGKLYAARSNDGGQTWTPPAPLPLESPESIARLLRLADGTILVAWNGVASKTQGPRDRLTVARSLDGGITWPQRREVVQGGPVFSNSRRDAERRRTRAHWLPAFSSRPRACAGAQRRGFGGTRSLRSAVARGAGKVSGNFAKETPQHVPLVPKLSLGTSEAVPLRRRGSPYLFGNLSTPILHLMNPTRSRFLPVILAGLSIHLAWTNAELDAQGWPGYARDAQHSCLAGVQSQPPQTIRWSTPVDLQPQYSGNDLFIHYGSPVITQANTVIVPVKIGASDGFEIRAYFHPAGAATAMLVGTVSTDYSVPACSWTPVCGATLTPQDNALVAPAAGGTVLVRSSPNAASGTTTRLAFHGLANYNSNPGAFNSAIKICTPISSDNAGNLYFGYISTGAALPGYPGGIPSGLARISSSGAGSFMAASTISGDNSSQAVLYNCAPAFSADGATLYVAVSNIPAGAPNNWGSGYLCALNSTTLARMASVFLSDPRPGVGAAAVINLASATPTVGPDGTTKIAGAFARAAAMG